MPQDIKPPKPREVSPCEGSQKDIVKYCTNASNVMTMAMCQKLAQTIAPAIRHAPKAASPVMAPPVISPPRGGH